LTSLVTRHSGVRGKNMFGAGAAWYYANGNPFHKLLFRELFPPARPGQPRDPINLSQQKVYPIIAFIYYTETFQNKMLKINLVGLIGIRTKKII
jgi:hypothetical protein